MERRTFLRHALASAAVAAIPAHARAAQPHTTSKGEGTLDLHAMIRPAPRTAKLAMRDWLVWGGSMVRTPDGTCHLLFSRWPRTRGHNAWCTHSQVAHATADHPLGPYTFQGIALAGAGGDAWDAHNIHNPNALRIGSKYYLYYNGNHGNGEYWNHRNNQRVGVAVADHPAGPWTRLDAPIVDVTRNAFDHLITTNPAVAYRPSDGKVVLVYKTVSRGKLPFGGRVRHGVAFADNPLGPFTKHRKPIFTHPTAKFPAEDPYIWWGRDRFYAIVKDQGGYFVRANRYALVLFESRDGLDWKLAPHPLVCHPEIPWEGGRVQKVHRLERPQLYLERGRPAVLFCAVSPNKTNIPSYNVHIPLKQF